SLRDGPQTVTALADGLGKSRSWISEVVADLEAETLVRRRDGRVELADTYETRLLAELQDSYDLQSVLGGKREALLETLHGGAATVAQLERAGFAASTVYDALGDLRASGVVRETEDGAYEIADETLADYLTARTRSGGDEYVADGGRITTGRDDGRRTAFSAFTRYGVDYYPTETYRYQGDEEIGPAEVLIHAVAVAETKKQTAMCGVFYLTHSGSLDARRLWRLADEWDCVEKWADLQAFLDRRDVHAEKLFLPWEEFGQLAREYGVYPRGKHPADSLSTAFDQLGSQVEGETELYLLGGGNLILRGLKDATKDIDVVVESTTHLRTLSAALDGLGYEERDDLEAPYEEMNPRVVLEKRGFPRWDIFVEVVASKLSLTDGMTDRVDETHRFGALTVHLLSLTDIFLFKSITDREGDLEDAALIARQTDLDWESLLAELQRQDRLSDRVFSFAVLDTLELLRERHDIETPIHDEVVSYCLETALLLSVAEGPKTIEEFREELEFPDHRIYNTLRALEADDRIEVDRSGRLNSYRLGPAASVTQS
ncbi:MAG: winged helix-turn-helix domain-containing protein, partial [Halobaculum sp.]